MAEKNEFRNPDAILDIKDLPNFCLGLVLAYNIYLRCLVQQY